MAFLICQYNSPSSPWLYCFQPTDHYPVINMSTDANSNDESTRSEPTSLSSIGGGYRCYTFDCDLYEKFEQTQTEAGLTLALEGKSANASLVLAFNARNKLVPAASSIIVEGDSQRQLFPYTQFRPLESKAGQPVDDHGCLIGDLSCTIDGIMGDKSLAFVWPVGAALRDGNMSYVTYG